MNSSERLFESAAVVIERFSHPPGQPHYDSDVETAARVAVSFVERGRFSLRQGKTWFSFGSRRRPSTAR